MSDSTVFKIRPAEPWEASLLTSLALRSKAHWQYAPNHLARWMDDLTLTENDIKTCPTFVAEREGVPQGVYMLGTAATEPVTGQAGALDESRIACDLAHFWVDPEAMGRGVGRALLEHAVSQAVRLGAKVLRIDADPQAEAFYSAMGARRVGTVPAPIEEAPGRIRPQLVIPLT